MNEHIKQVNRSLVWGWMLIVGILFVTYSMEVVKQERTVTYLLAFLAATVIPALVILVIYLKQPDRYRLRYEIVIGYFIMYTFVMITGSTTMVFSYILPMLSLLVLYHEPKIILRTGIAALVLNLVFIGNRAFHGELNHHNTKDVEIQIALILLCFWGSYLATQLYDDIHHKNEEVTGQLRQQNEAIQSMTMQTILTIANTIDAKDEYTRGHSRRVSEYAAAVAAEMGLSEAEISEIRFIGLLHDIGKIGVPDAILNKPGKLTNEEYQLMKNHTTIGSDILKDISMIRGLDIGARYHHERYDGRGYPEGLAGKEIPLIARIIAVADAYDAMTSNRVYRRHLMPERVMEELHSGLGTQWDPECTQVMIRLVEEERLPHVDIEEIDPEMLRQTSTILTRVIDAASNAAADGYADVDELTGVYTREAGMTAIQTEISRQGRGCLLLFDIDRFHRINDTDGFVIGDLYLRALVRLIRGVFEDGIIVRCGSDEFAVFHSECDSAAGCTELIRRFYQMLQQKVQTDPVVRHLSVSVGMMEIATEKDRLSVLYENASKALYVAKQQGGNTYYCHHIGAQTEFPADSSAAADLQQLIEVLRSGGRTALQDDDCEPDQMHETLKSMLKEGERFVQIILFTVKPAEGLKPDIASRDEVMRLLNKAIINSIRTDDFVTRNSSTQYAVLLSDITTEKTQHVIDRILTAFLRTYDKQEFEVRYDAADLTNPAVLAGTESEEEA